jgi:hypothetical protein
MFLLVPEFLVAHFLYSRIWLLTVPAALVLAVLLVAALGPKRRVTPQKWADELEKHLLGTDRPYDWDDATSVKMADHKLENLRARLIPRFDSLDTAEKREELRQIIQALRRGEIP